MIEEKLDRIISLLEAAAGKDAPKQAAPETTTAAPEPAKPPKKEKTEKPKEEKEPTADDVTEAIKNAVAGGKRADVTEILAGYGVSRGSQLKPEDIKLAFTELKKLLA